MSQKQNAPVAARTAARGDAGVGFGGHQYLMSYGFHTQLRRLGDSSRVVAFLDQGNVCLGVIARTAMGWSALPTGSSHCPTFRTALRAVRFLQRSAA